MRLAIAPGPTVHWLFRSHDLLSKYRSLQCSSVAHVYQAFLSLPPKFTAQVKPKIFLLWADVHHVYAHAWTLCFFHILVSTQIFRRAPTGSVDSCAEIKSAPSMAYAISARVWRKVPESDGRSVGVEVTHDVVVCTPATQRRTPFIKVVSVCIRLYESRFGLAVRR